MLIDLHEKFYEFLNNDGRGKNIKKCYDQWCKSPQEYLDKKSPEEYLNDISDLNLLIEMLKIYKKDIPPVLLKRIKDFKSKAVKPLGKIATDEKLLSEQCSHMALNAIYILGEMQYVSSIPYLITVLEKTDENSIYYQYGVDGVIKFKDKAVEYIIKSIKNSENEIHRGNLAWLLCRIGKNDVIFEALLDLCKNSRQWKGYYAEILAEYKDKRAIETIQKIALEKVYSYEEHDQFERALVLLGGEWDWEHEKASAEV